MQSPPRLAWNELRLGMRKIGKVSNGRCTYSTRKARTGDCSKSSSRNHVAGGQEWCGKLEGKVGS